MKLGMIGYGRWGRTLARNVGANDGLELARIAHRSAPCQGCFTNDPQWLIEDKTLEGVIIAAPLAVRAPLIERALVAGKHVFTEKPLALDETTAAYLVDTAVHAGLVLFTNYVHAYGPGIEYLCELLPSLPPVERLRIDFRQPGALYVSEDATALLGSHVFAILYRLARALGAAEAKAITLEQTQCGHFAAWYSACVGTSGVRVDLAVNVNHPSRSRRIDLWAGPVTASAELTGRTGVSLCRAPQPLEQDNVAPQAQFQPFDESNNIARAIGAFATAVRDRTAGNTAMALAVQHLLAQAQAGAGS